MDASADLMGSADKLKEVVGKKPYRPYLDPTLPDGRVNPMQGAFEWIDNDEETGHTRVKMFAQKTYEYDWVFNDVTTGTSFFDPEKTQLANTFKDRGRCLLIVDKRVYGFYKEAIKKYFAHHSLALEVLELGIDEEQKSGRTQENVMKWLANVGVARLEPPLVMGGGLITDVVGAACAQYRRDLPWIRMPTTLIGMVDASIAIKTGANLVEKHKNRIGAFHPHQRCFIDFSLLETLPPQHIRNGVSELIKISSVAEDESFDLLDLHGSELIKYQFGYAKDTPPEKRESLRVVGMKIMRQCTQRQLELEAPNLMEHDSRRAIAFGHTWSPVYELLPKPFPMHHGQGIAIDMAFSMTWAAREGWITDAARDRFHNVLRKCGLSLNHPVFTSDRLLYGTTTILERRDGDLFAAIPIPDADAPGDASHAFGNVRYINIGTDFETREALDRSLQKAYEDHKELCRTRYENDGEGTEIFITKGLDHTAQETLSKRHLGTYAEVLVEDVERLGKAQSFWRVDMEAAKISERLKQTSEFMVTHSSKLPEKVAQLVEATTAEKPFPEGMDVNWALDTQSAQSLQMFASLSNGEEAWDLGTLTGTSAAVLANIFPHVKTVEREGKLVEFARKHLPSNVDVKQDEILSFLEKQAAAGGQADFIFMDLDKPQYTPVYEAIMQHGLLKSGGLLLCDNVLYRGLTAEADLGILRAEHGTELTEGTLKNAEMMAAFLKRVKQDSDDGEVTTLMMPVRDGMMCIKRTVA
jgi:3-dehydroquinate synthase